MLTTTTFFAWLTALRPFCFLISLSLPESRSDSVPRVRPPLRNCVTFSSLFCSKIGMDSLTPRTGDGELDTSAILESALDIFRPVMESATVMAAHYAKACGRDVVLQEDMRFGMMFAARYVTGRQIGSLFPEIYEDASDSQRESSGSEGSDYDPDGSESSGSWETVSDSEMVWTRYEGTDDDQALKMNECADSWDSWEPQNPSERALKNAIDKQSDL